MSPRTPNHISPPLAGGGRGRVGSVSVLSGFFLLGIFGLFCACATGGGKLAGSDLPPVIRQDLTLAGTVRIKGAVKVLSGATLTIAPGARLLFAPYDPDRDGINDSALLVEGGLVARGDPGAPILLSSAAEKPEPGDWLEVRVDRAEGVVLQYCVMEYARNGFHAHFSSGVISDCIFRRNIDGTHLGGCRFVVEQTRFTRNTGAGITFRDSTLTVLGNIFDSNRIGVFLFEKDGHSRIRGNLFGGNVLADLRYGDFFSGARPEILHNSTRIPGGSLKVMEAEGEVVFLTADPSPPEDRFGPSRMEVHLSPLWQVDLGAFVDAAPVKVWMEGGDHKVAVATWGGDLVQLGLEDGKEQCRTRIGEIIDATPALWNDLILFPAWDRKVRAVAIGTGKVVWEWEWPPSNQDDHRQASPLVLGEGGGQVIVGLWNGDLASLNPSSGIPFWIAHLDGAIRAQPALVPPEGILAGTDAGVLYRVSTAGVVGSLLRFGSPVRTTPLVEREGQGCWVATGDGSLRRIQGMNVTWTRKAAGQATHASPESGGDHFTVMGDSLGMVSAYFAQGAVGWRSGLDSAVQCLNGSSSPWVFAGTEGGTCYVLSADTGRILATVQTDGAIHGRPLFDEEGQILVLGSRDGMVRASRLLRRSRPWQGPE